MAGAAPTAPALSAEGMPVNAISKRLDHAKLGDHRRYIDHIALPDVIAA